MQIIFVNICVYIDHCPLLVSKSLGTEDYLASFAFGYDSNFQFQKVERHYNFNIPANFGPCEQLQNTLAQSPVFNGYVFSVNELLWFEKGIMRPPVNREGMFFLDLEFDLF